MKLIPEKKYICTFCKIEFTSNLKWKRDVFVSKGRVYCSKECGKKYHSEISKKTMIETNKKYASARMKKENSMWKPGAINKMIDTKNKNNTLHIQPLILGGNGRETPLPVKLLNEKLNWTLRYILKTGVRQYYPTHYKLEIANVEKKIAIEIDGNGMYSRKEEIEKKENLLKSLGWQIIRFKNRDVLKNLDDCVQKCNLVAEKEYALGANKASVAID